MNPQFNKGIKSLKESVAVFQLGLKEALEPIEKYTFEVLDNLENQILEAESKIAELETTYEQKRKMADLDFNLALKEDKRQACFKFAKETNHVLLTQQELQELKDSSLFAQQKIDEASASAISSTTAKYKAEISNIQSEHKVNTAQLNAENQTLKDKNAFLEQQLVLLREQLANAQEATVKVAQANSATVNVNGK